MRALVKPLGGSGRENVVKNTSSVLPVKHEFSQAILEGKVDPIGVLTYGRESLPADFVLNAKFEEAKAAEQSALNKVNDYVATYFGSLDLRDPAELNTLKANASEATKTREALQAQVEAQEYADKYSQKTYKDNFFGQTGASYTLGRINQDSALAWNDYLKNPTAENKDKAQQIDATLQQFWSNNAQTLDEDATLPWISQSVASQIPQTLDRLKYGAVGAAGGAVVGSAIPVVGTVTGAKLGYTAGSTKYAYDTMRGAAFRNLLAHGVDEETAKAAAGNEAVLNSLIEAGDTGADIATLGAGTAAKRALGYGANILTEGGQEGAQEIVSAANLRRAQEGQTGVWGLAKDSLKLGWDALTGKDPETAEQVKAAGKEGMKVATMLNGTAHLAAMPFALTASPVFSSTPVLTANEISAMQKQLADMQFQQQVDELAAVYEKNVPSLLLKNPNMESFVEKTSPIDEKLLEMGLKSSKIETGAMKGAYNDKNDPDGLKRETHAERYYTALRNSNSKSVISAISQNSRIDEKTVSKMFNHLIKNEYELDKGYTHFDSDYYIAESLRRLREGTNIQPHDLVLIQHEAMEHDLMNNEGLNYDEAHALANKSYNYQEALITWLKKEGK